LDITTKAKPEEIQKIFPDNFYENKFGTVTVKPKAKKKILKKLKLLPIELNKIIQTSDIPIKSVSLLT